MSSDFELAKAKKTMCSFFMSAISIGLHAPANEVKYGHPVSQLIKDAAENSVDGLAEHLLRYEQGEYRLNGAGLKVFWRWERQSELKPGRLCLSVLSDHGHVYDDTVNKLKELIKERGWAWYN
jgi:hypothetical protein